MLLDQAGPDIWNGREAAGLRTAKHVTPVGRRPPPTTRSRRSFRPTQPLSIGTKIDMGESGSEGKKSSP
jgi:hypothetical protein